MFRFNRRTSRKRGLLFYRLLELAVRARPTTYETIVWSRRGLASTVRGRPRVAADNGFDAGQGIDGRFRSGEFGYEPVRARMAIAQNKQVVRRYYEAVVNGGALDALDELAVPDYEEHDPFPGQGVGREGLRRRVTMLRTSFRQHLTIEEMVAEGDRVVVRWTSSGTHEGDFMGIPATGRSFAIAGIDIYAMSDGKMAEHWHVVDLLGLLQQLGVIAQPANPGRSPQPASEAAADSPRPRRGSHFERR